MDFGVNYATFVALDKQKLGNCDFSKSGIQSQRTSELVLLIDSDELTLKRLISREKHMT